jgi:hypothetical protein
MIERAGATPEQKKKKGRGKGAYWMSEIDNDSVWDAKLAESELMLDVQVRRRAQEEDIDIRSNIQGIMGAMAIALDTLQRISANQNYTRRLNANLKAINEAKTGTESPFQASKRSSAIMAKAKNNKEIRKTGRKSSGGGQEELHGFETDAMSSTGTLSSSDETAERGLGHMP